jgi:hypothetical protein
MLHSGIDPNARAGATTNAKSEGIGRLRINWKMREIRLTTAIGGQNEGGKLFGSTKPVNKPGLAVGVVAALARVQAVKDLRSMIHMHPPIIRRFATGSGTGIVVRFALSEPPW